MYKRQLYGRHRLFPDLAAAPWYEYRNNEQYLHQLHVIGHGEYNLESLMIDDTPIDNFPEVQYQIIRPGGNITLFDPDVAVAAEVSGQELLTNETVGAFIINPSYTRTNRLHLDMVWPRGLYYANDNGSLGAKTTHWRVEVRRIDDDDIALGGWYTLTNASLSPVSYTHLTLPTIYSV